MSLLSDKTVSIFTPGAVERGTCVRFRRAGDTTFRNGFVTKVCDAEIEIVYSNTQNNAQSHLQMRAVDVAVGVWEIFWTTDFQTVNYENNAGGGGNV